MLYTVLWTQKELIMHVSAGVGMNIFKFLETLKNDNEKWNYQFASFPN